MWAIERIQVKPSSECQPFTTGGIPFPNLAHRFYRRGVIKSPFKVIGMSELQKVSNRSKTSRVFELTVLEVYDMMHEGKIAGRYVVDTSK